MAQEKGEMYRAGLPVLGARLLSAAQMVAPGRPAADIGCDHGKLAVWLAKQRTSPRVIAVDSRPMPLQRARALVAQTGCTQAVDCRLGSGLGALAPGEAKEIVIAGLSGETIVDILEECPWCKSEDMHFVLLPTGRHPQLRRWLCQNGFAILKEEAVLESGRGYVVFSVGYTGVPTQPDELFCQVGTLPACEDKRAVTACLRGRLVDLKKQTQGPMDTTAREQHEKLMMEVEACLP